MLGAPPFFPNQVTFVLHDAGETNALRPVMEKLDRQGVSYSILATSTARGLLQNNTHLVPLPQDVVTLSQANPLAAQQAQAVLLKALQAPCVVTGLVSPFQQQWAQYFKACGKTVLGYLDNVAVRRTYNPAQNFNGLLSALLSPSEFTSGQMRPRLPWTPVLTVGQPTVEQPPEPWGLSAESLGLSPQKPIFLYVGGKGPQNQQAFATFCQALKAQPNVQGVFSPHPGELPQAELALMKALKLEDRVKLAPQAFETKDLLPIVDAVVTHQSTFGVQALVQNKPVLYVGGQDPDILNPVESLGLASRYTNTADLARGIAWTVQAKSPTTGQFKQQALGIPAQATDRITRLVQQAVGRF